jgi:hypothetical protein
MGIFRMVLIVGMLFISNSLYAETIWCKAFKAGCVTEEQKIRHQQYCEQRGNEGYSDALSRGLVDPALWQSAGMRSAQDYAMMVRRNGVSTCLKMTNPSSF